MDLSKLLTYEFHYKYTQLKYGTDEATFLFADTEILVYEIEKDDVYEKFYKKKRIA